MEPEENTLSLYRPVQYAIEVQGYLDDTWSEWIAGMSISMEVKDEIQPVTVLTCRVDQAALHGILRRLYGLGLPLISVSCIEFQSAD